MITSLIKKSIAISISLLVFIAILLSCNQHQQKDDAQYQQSALYEIFSLVLDSVHVDSRLLPPPPIPPDMLEKKGYSIKKEGYENAYNKWTASEEYKNMMRAWQFQVDSIKRDTTSYYIIVQDTVHYSERKGIEYYRETNDSTSALQSSKNFMLDKTKLLTNHKNHKFIFRREFPEERTFWTRTRIDKVVAEVFFSRIVFDKIQNQVILDVSYVSGILDGSGFRIYVNKSLEGTWSITKIMGTWIS